MRYIVYSYSEILHYRNSNHLNATIPHSLTKYISCERRRQTSRWPWANTLLPVKEGICNFLSANRKSMISSLLDNNCAIYANILEPYWHHYIIIRNHLFSSVNCLNYAMYNVPTSRVIYISLYVYIHIVVLGRMSQGWNIRMNNFRVTYQE